MKKLIAAVLVILVCFGGGMAWKIQQLKNRKTQLPRDTAAADFAAADLKGYKVSDNYCALLEYASPEDTPGDARFFFEVGDSSHYSVLELSGTNKSLKLFKVTAGVITAQEQVEISRFPRKIYLYRRGSSIDLINGSDGSGLFSGMLPSGKGEMFGTAATGGADCPLSILRLEQATEPSLTDDFMRTSTDPGQWEYLGGNWQVRSLANPARSSNAFVLQGESKGVALSGGDNWNNYRAECSALLPGGGECRDCAISAHRGKDYLLGKGFACGEYYPLGCVKIRGERQKSAWPRYFQRHGKGAAGIFRAVAQAGAGAGTKKTAGLY